MDIRLWLGTPHGRTARSANPSCPYPGNERRKLPPRISKESSAPVRATPVRGANPPKGRERNRQDLNQNSVPGTALRFAPGGSRHTKNDYRTRATRPFYINQTGTLLLRHLAHFCSAVDTLTFELHTGPVAEGHDQRPDTRPIEVPLAKNRWKNSLAKPGAPTHAPGLTETDSI